MFSIEIIDGEPKVLARVDLTDVDWNDVEDFERRCAVAHERAAQMAAIIESENVVIFPGAFRSK
jgi:hypothetical protein